MIWKDSDLMKDPGMTFIVLVYLVLCCMSSGGRNFGTSRRLLWWAELGGKQVSLRGAG